MARHDMIPNSETTSSPVPPSDACDYTILWKSVIVQALRDATLPFASCATSQQRYDRRVAHFWLTRNGEDFRTACENAAVDPERVMAFYKRLRDSGRYIRGNGIARVV